MLTDSEFYMWRTIYALSFADNFLANEEVCFMSEKLEELDLSSEQKKILQKDIHSPKDPMSMYREIKSEKDKKELFHQAYSLFWIDGVFHPDEMGMLKILKDEFEREKHKKAIL